MTEAEARKWSHITTQKFNSFLVLAHCVYSWVYKTFSEKFFLAGCVVNFRNTSSCILEKFQINKLKKLETHYFLLLLFPPCPDIQFLEFLILIASRTVIRWKHIRNIFEIFHTKYRRQQNEKFESSVEEKSLSWGIWNFLTFCCCQKLSHAMLLWEVKYTLFFCMNIAIRTSSVIFFL